MSRIGTIKMLVLSGMYYLTEHADAEAELDGLDIYDLENVLLHGSIRRTWPRENKHEVLGHALDGRSVGVVCRVTQGMKVRVITAYEDKRK